MKRTPALILFFLLFSSCHNGKNPDNEQLFRKTEQLLVEHPDSSLSLLQTMNPGKLSREEYAAPALYYACKIPQTTTGDMPEFMLDYHHLTQEISVQKNDYQAALREAQLQSAQARASKRTSISCILEQHEKKQMENNHNRTVIHQLRLITVVVVLSGILAGWFLMSRMKRKETGDALLVVARHTLKVYREMIIQQDDQLRYCNSQIARRDEQLHTYSELLMEQSGQLKDYDRILLEYNEKNERLRAILLDWLDIIRRVAQINVISTENTRTFMSQFHKVFGKNLLDWETMRPVINDLYDCFVDKLAAEYPDLSDKDLQLCSLIRAGFRTEEMAVLMNMTPNSLRVKRTRLVKRIGFDNAKAFFSHLYNL